MPVHHAAVKHWSTAEFNTKSRMIIDGLMQPIEPLLASILVTGANGFLGKAIVERFRNENVDVVGATRHTENGHRAVLSPSLESASDWRPILCGRSLVIHTAGRAHVMNERVKNPIRLFRKINTEGTLELANQAAESGVRRFLFLSSIGVNGTQSTKPFQETDYPNPTEAYAVSKFEAEQGLMELAGRKGMEVVIIRPPLVYGPNAPGNYGRLESAVRRNLPLPLGAVTQNRRTLIGLDNLVDLIVTCARHPSAANQIFLAGDGEDLSTTELLRRMAQAFGVRARLLPVPVALMRLAANAVGKGAMIDRLCGTLQVDIGKARDVLGWTPPLSISEGLARAADNSRAGCDK